jgi:hypothetical protein
MASTNIQTFPGKVGVSNTNPIHTLDIGSNVYIDDTAQTKLRIIGNIHASGVTVDGTITAIDSENLSVKDPIILLASGSTGTSDTGIIMKRADGDSNVAVFYDEGVGLKIGHTLSTAQDIHISVDSSNSLSTSIYGPVTVAHSSAQALVVQGGAEIADDFKVGASKLFVDVSESNVGIGTDAPLATLDVHGTANVGALTVVSISGDGSALSSIQSSNVSDFASNVGRIGTLETDLTSNVGRIGTLETDLTSNVGRIGTLETDLTSNVGRIETLETDLTSNVGRIGTLETDLTSNVTRITNLESSDMTIGGEKTFSSNLEVGTANLFVDTTTSNVGIGTVSPAYTLDVHGTANVGALMATLTYSNAASNIVTWNSSTNEIIDSGLEKGFTEHPVAAMTGYHTYVEGHGTYEASASSSSPTYYPWQAFDHVAGSETRWSIASPQNKYNVTTGEWDQTAISAYPNIYTSDVGGTRYAGHWLQIKLPYAITLSHSNVHPTNGFGLDRAPKDGVILGSNDGEYWYKLTEFSGKTYSNNTWTRIDVNATTPYQYYRMCITKVVGGTYGSYTELTEWRLFAEKDVTKFENVHISGDLSSETLQTGYIKWPRKPLKANESEGYVASASSAPSFDVFTLYNEILVGAGTEYWSTNVTYTNGVHDNTVSTTDINGVVHYGEWAQIQLPTEVALSFLKVYPRRYGTDLWPLQRVPSAGSILGSNDGTTWKNIQRFSGVTYTLESTVSGEKIDVHASETYKYYRLVCTTLSGVTSAADRVDMMELQLFEAATGVGGAPTSAKLQVHGSLGLAKGSSLYAGDSVVAEFPKHDRPLTKYPEIVLTSAASYAYQEGYKVQRSSENSSNPAYNLFDGNIVTRWLARTSAGDSYNASSPYEYTGSNDITTTDGTAHEGAWVRLELPKKIRLAYTKIIDNTEPPTRTPGKVTFLGSNNDTDWHFIKEFSGMSPDVREYTYHINETTYYKHYAFVVKNISDGDAGIDLGEWELYGTEEGDESVDVVHRSVPNKPGQQQLAVYWDANDSNSYSFADSSNVYDLSGSGVTGVITGTNGFDAEYNAWVFDGSDIRSTVNTFSGDQPHTMSVWVYISNALTTADGYISILAPNTGETIDEVSSIRFQNDGFNMQSWGNDIQMYNLGIQKERWYHLTAVYDGGGVTTASKRLYINSVQEIRISTDATSGNTINFTNTTLSLGSRVDGTGVTFKRFHRQLPPLLQGPQRRPSP